RAKQLGFSDRQLAVMWGITEMEVRKDRKRRGIIATFKSVDTCAAEFEAYTPYYYSTYEDEDEVPAKPEGGKRIVILGGGPNRIGQGIEFDYCCCHASFAMKELGIESVMINSNPETVSTDYDTSDLLFFEPLTHEDILNICERLNGKPFSGDPKGSTGLVKGVIVQFGGQTPLNLARGLSEAGGPIVGTSVDSLDEAGDREQFRALLQKLGLKQPANGIAHNVEEARKIARDIGYPVLVRPSFVLGGRAMEIVSDEQQLDYYMEHAVEAASGSTILVDKFLDNATEVDVDCIADFPPLPPGEGRGEGARENSKASKTDSTLTPALSRGEREQDGQAFIIGVMEHIEEAGIHSGDSACA